MRRSWGWGRFVRCDLYEQGKNQAQASARPAGALVWSAHNNLVGVQCLGSWLGPAKPVAITFILSETLFPNQSKQAPTDYLSLFIFAAMGERCRKCQSLQIPWHSIGSMSLGVQEIHMWHPASESPFKTMGLCGKAIPALRQSYLTLSRWPLKEYLPEVMAKQPS